MKHSLCVFLACSQSKGINMLKTILIVDDDRNILNGLRRMLRPKRHIWNVLFATGAVEALDIMAKQKVDLLISDMKMPQVDGAMLLRKVRRKYPKCIRIILSGFHERESVFKTIGPAHQFLSKPCVPEEFIMTIEKTLGLRKFLSSCELLKILSSLQSTPILPDSYIKMLSCFETDEKSGKEVAAIISQDISMTYEILKLANSAYFAKANKYVDIETAVRMIGLDTIKVLIIKVGIFQSFSGNIAERQTLFKINKFSQNLCETALEIANTNKLSHLLVSQVVTASLLSNIGMVILLDKMTEKFNQLPTYIQKYKSLNEAEKKLFGATHAQIGAYILGIWGFSDLITEAVAYHLSPSQLNHHQSKVLACLHAAWALTDDYPISAPIEAKLDYDFMQKHSEHMNFSNWPNLLKPKES